MLRVFDLARNFSEFILNAQKKKKLKELYLRPQVILYTGARALRTNFQNISNYSKLFYYIICIWSNSSGRCYLVNNPERLFIVK